MASLNCANFAFNLDFSTWKILSPRTLSAAIMRKAYMVIGMVIRSSSCYLYGGSVTLMNRIQVGLLDTSSGSPFPPQSFPMHTKLLHAYHPTHLGHWLIKEGLQNLSHGIVLLWGTLFSQGLSGMKISNNKKVAEKRQCLLGFNLIWNMHLWDLVT